MADEVVILVTCPAPEAERIATALVDERLVACVNILPKIVSVYRWDNKTCKDDESLLVIKSSKHLWDALEPRIRELHTYEIPEIICIPIELGSEPYLNWINSQLRDAPITTGNIAIG